MTEDERGILIVDAIFYVFLGLVLLISFVRKLMVLTVR